MTLTNKYTWEELCEITISKTNIPLKERTAFRKWFMEREVLGYLFDYNLIKRCFFIWKELKNNLDHFIVVSGREGFGKSTLAIQIASWVNPNFTTDYIVYKASSFVDIMRDKANKFETDPDVSNSILMDEGTELMSRESLNLTNRTLTKTFFIQRALKFLVIVNIPNFHMLDSVVRHHRVRTLIEVTDRGKYKAITGSGIKTIAKEGAILKETSGIRLKDGTFWHGYFTKEFPKTIDRSEYELHKHNGIRETLEQLKDEVIQMKMIQTNKVAKELGMASDTLISMIKKQELEGKQIGSRWYITRKAYDKLMMP